jgi:hypothetical protein
MCVDLVTNGSYSENDSHADDTFLHYCVLATAQTTAKSVVCELAERH